MNSNNKKGFTLIEILLVLAILSILAGIVIIAISPAKNLRQAATTQRKADMNTILNAIYQYAIDNAGALPPTINSLAVNTYAEICKSGIGNCTNGNATTTVINLGNDTTPTYVAAMPVDPAGNACSKDDAAIGTADDTACYGILKLGGTPTRVRVYAPDNLNADTGAAEMIYVER